MERTERWLLAGGRPHLRLDGCIIIRPWKTTIWINSSLYIQHFCYTTRNLNRYNDHHLPTTVIDCTLQTSEATVRSFPRTSIWCLPDNERSDCALVSKDVDSMFTWQRAKRLCARFQGRRFDVYLTTSEATVRSFPKTLIWCLPDNERSDCALVSNDVDLIFTWQRAKRLCARL